MNFLGDLKIHRDNQSSSLQGHTLDLGRPGHASSEVTHNTVTSNPSSRLTHCFPDKTSLASIAPTGFLGQLSSGVQGDCFKPPSANLAHPLHPQQITPPRFIQKKIDASRKEHSSHLPPSRHTGLLPFPPGTGDSHPHLACPPDSGPSSTTFSGTH